MKVSIHHLLCLLGLVVPMAQSQAQSPPPPLPTPTDIDSSMTAIRCEVRAARVPDAVQVFYFYLSDTRRQVLETDGNPLGSVVSYSRQRIVVTKSNYEGGGRTFTIDRMLGAITIAMPAGSREPWSLSGECQRVDATRPKF